MRRIKDLVAIVQLIWLQWWRGECVVTLSQTDKCLQRDYKVKGRTYSFRCIEYVYKFTPSSWWRVGSSYYLYKVNMDNDGDKSEGFYPILTSWGVGRTTHNHHLAIRAHIELTLLS